MTLLLVVTILLMGLIVAWPTVKDAVISELVDTGATVDAVSQSYSFSGMQGSQVAGSDFIDAVDAGQTAGDDPAGDFGRSVALVPASDEIVPPSCENTFPGMTGFVPGFSLCCAVDSANNGSVPGCSAGDTQGPFSSAYTTCLRRLDPTDSLFGRPQPATTPLFVPGQCSCDAGNAWFLFPGEACPVA